MKMDDFDKLILKAAPAPIEPSPDFDRRFWQKVLEREKEPRIFRIFEWVPMPSLSQAAAVLLIAIIIGGGGGYVSAMSSRPPMLTLSGFSEFKGVPAPSVAGVYLKVSEAGESE